jgi:dihydroorotate dehydrogenase
MISVLHRLLLKCPPEVSHHIAIALLRIYQKITSYFGEQKAFSSFHIRLKSTPSINFANRVGLAAGFDKNAECFSALARLGFGFIEIGTVTPMPQEGNSKPRLWRVEPEGLINQMGFNNCGVNEFKQNLRKYRPYCQVPILANIGKNKVTPNESALEDYRILFSQLSDDVDGFVVNISSPNTVGLRELQSVEFLDKIEKIAPKKPVWVKLAPDLDESSLRELFIQIKKSSVFQGCVLTNTSREIALNVYQRTEGGYSGEKLFNKTCEVVGLCREIFQEEKSIIGVGGINSPERAKKMKQVGADLIEIYTGFVYQGPGLIKALVDGLAD